MCDFTPYESRLVVGFFFLKKKRVFVAGLHDKLTKEKDGVQVTEQGRAKYGVERD
jgi:hypothetical protein